MLRVSRRQKKRDYGALRERLKKRQTGRSSHEETNMLLSKIITHKWTCANSCHRMLSQSVAFIISSRVQNSAIEACVPLEHLCPIWVSSVTPVQMATGCEHLVSPVPIHPPLNGSFDTPRCLTWLLPFWVQKKATTLALGEAGGGNSKKRRRSNIFFPKFWSEHTTSTARTSDPPQAGHRSPFWSHSVEILISNCPSSCPPAQRLNQIYNYCQRPGWQIN